MKHIERAGTRRSPGHVLILTDDAELTRDLENILSPLGLRVLEASDIQGALDLIGQHAPTLVCLDMDAPTVLTDTLFESLESDGARGLIFLVSEVSADRLPGAGVSGGVCLRKPVLAAEVVFAFGQLQRGMRWRRETELYGSSPQIQVIRKLVAEVAVSDAHVIVTGEAGVGKRIVGRLIHTMGPRRTGPFGQLGCAGFSEGVLGDLLFGGTESPEGYLDACRRGTLLLDDIDVLPLGVQARLSSWLTEHREVAGSLPRIVAVTSRSLSDQVRAGAFDSGLFELLDRGRIEIPPLRERKADIPILADRFSRAAGPASGRRVRGIESRALAELMRYDWPGNVRELRDILEHAMTSCEDGVIGVDDLPALPEAVNPAGPGPKIPGATIHEIERDAILKTLEMTGGSTSQAARILDMSVRKIQYKLKEYRAEAASLAVESRPALAARRTPSPGVSSPGVMVAGRSSRRD